MFEKLFGKKKKEVKEEIKNIDVTSEKKNEILKSPIKGNVIDLSQVKDQVFSSGMMGKGIAIEPEEGVVVSPVNGKIATLFPTGHAIGIISDGGCEILIHIGMDTVEMNGKGFRKLVQEGDLVKVGQKLVEFDVNAIKEAGYQTISPVIVTNSDDYNNVVNLKMGTINLGEDLIEVVFE